MICKKFNQNDAMGMFHYYDLPSSEIFIFDQFLICQIKEGKEIRPSHNAKLNGIIQDHFSGQNIVYISNRINSYSVDPLTYSETEKIPNLIAIAIVPETGLMRKNAEFERGFYHKPYEVFGNLSEAIEWVHTIIENNSSTK